MVALEFMCEEHPPAKYRNLVCELMRCRWTYTILAGNGPIWFAIGVQMNPFESTRIQRQCSILLMWVDGRKIVKYSLCVRNCSSIRLQARDIINKTIGGKMRLKRTMTSAVLVTMAFASGCASLRLVAREKSPHEKEIFVEQCGWDLDLEGGKKEIRVSERGTIGAVHIHTNYFYALMTVISLGHWMPFDVRYEVNHE